ncbi:MAG: hypothetical protein ACKV2Q_08260 [Planctomycetaceae bacterium]
MAISFFGLIVVGIISVTLLYVAAKGLSIMLSLLKSTRSGHATLACPHCGQQTSHGRGCCDVCGHEL